MKKGLLYLVAVVALVGCSKEQEGTRTENDTGGNAQRSASTVSNEAAGAANSNAPSVNAPSIQAPATPAQTNGTNAQP